MEPKTYHLTFENGSADVLVDFCQKDGVYSVTCEQVPWVEIHLLNMDSIRDALEEVAFEVLQYQQSTRH